MISIASETYGGGTPKTKIVEYWQGNFPWIQSSDLKQDELTNVTAQKFISTKAIKNSATKVIPKNSIAIVTRVGVGKLALMPYSYSTSQDFISLSNLNINSHFGVYSLYKLLQKEKKNIQGTSIKGITKKDLLEKKISIPQNYTEQQRIGRMFLHLDRTIALHQQEIDLLKQIKKGFLQKMFSRKEESVPELRFKGFSDNWQERKLGNYLVKSLTKNKDEIFTNIESVSNKHGFISQTEQFENRRVASKNLSNYYIVKPKMFAYNPSRINVGSIAYKKVGDHISVVSPLYEVFSSKKDLYDLFLWYWFDTSIFERERINRTEGSVRDTLNYSSFSEIKTRMPSKEEQQKIGYLFKHIDEEIILQKNNLIALKQAKKGLLQKMFI